MKIYEISFEDEKNAFIKTNASPEATQEAIDFVKQREDYDFEKFCSALRLLGYKVMVINTDADDIFEL